jgi:hypothetical protein
VVTQERDCERCGRTAQAQSRIGEMQALLSLREAQLKAVVELQRAAALRLGRAYALLVHEWRSETEQTEEAQAQRLLYEKKLYEKKPVRKRDQQREQGGAGRGAAQQPRYASDYAEFPLGEEGEYPELQEEAEDLWSAGAEWSGVGTGRVMPPAPPRAFQPGYPKGIQTKTLPTKSPKGPAGKRMPRVAQLAGPLPPPPPPPPLPLPSADMAAPLNDCAMTMAALDKLLRSDAMRYREQGLQSRMQPSLCGRDGGLGASRTLGVLSVERHATAEARQSPPTAPLQPAPAPAPPPAAALVNGRVLAGATRGAYMVTQRWSATCSTELASWGFGGTTPNPTPVFVPLPGTPAAQRRSAAAEAPPPAAEASASAPQLASSPVQNAREPPPPPPPPPSPPPPQRPRAASPVLTVLLNERGVPPSASLPALNRPQSV